MQENRKISVIMGIYNCERTLAESIDCIVGQTYTNWELIMCDDGSKDGTLHIAEEYLKMYPEKIVVLKNDINRGLNYTLNKCLKQATGGYIARMDGDDRCSPTRFEKEITALDANPAISIVSTDMVYFDEFGTWGCIQHPTFPVPRDFPKESPFCHAPCLVRKEAFDCVGGYSEQEMLLRVEDYHLWIKMYAKGYKGMNLHEPLYQMRDDSSAYSRRKMKYRINEAYVKILAVKELDIPEWMCVYALRPIITGIMPNCIYDWLHKKRLDKTRNRK